MVLWFYSLKKLWFSGSMVVKKTWFSGSMVVKNQVLWFFGLKKLWFSGHPSVLLHLRFLIPGNPFLCFIKKFH